ncbi:ATP-binding protein [Nostoc sp. ChiVER01]|uniref:ATP-binding protein n=1 Tax=Nostoc sp. ChiVER01 TaxID=3075382 RepID=UPI002AD56A48|nr:AAA family ATPase [Nostoc sp. ChiVER01]MDZ8225396.1 AAA family ATPase [Nostoc sp. ChiVER01]
MTSSPISSIEDINAALQNHNPFALPPYVGSQEVWGKEFPDVTTLNAHASDAVFQAINQIRTGQYQRTSIAITAESGTGKTHIISRIRHRLQTEGGALFIYATEFSDLNNIKHGFQRTLGDSLGKTGSQGVTQWQELASAIANQAVKSIHPNAQTLLSKDLVQKLSRNELSKNRTLVNQLTEAFRKTKPNLKNPDIIRAILWTLVDSEALYAVKWLSGDELAQYKANELCLPSINGQSFDVIQQILDLISDYYQLVICFDELESTDINNAGFTKSQVVAGLVKELFENLSRGVILTVMMPAIWTYKIKQLPGGIPSKVSAYGNPIDLKYMNGDSIIELVTLWLTEFYGSRNFVPPHRLYPFTELQLRDLSSEEKPPVRKVLQWCRDNCKPADIPIDEGYPLIILKEDPVEQAFKKELSQEFTNYLDDNYLLADAILFSFQTLINKTVERVKIEQVTEKVKQRGGKDDYLNFKIIGKEDGKYVSIGVAVLQYAGGKALGAGLRRLIDYKTFGLTRGCLIRSKSKDKKISPHLHKTYIEVLIVQGGEFAELKEEEIRPLLAIRSVYKKREIDYGFTEEQILNFINEKGVVYQLGASNALLKEILSDPSYQVPEDILESDAEILDVNSYSESSELANISELAVAVD